jgi:flagellar biosynthetic protein FliO
MSKKSKRTLLVIIIILIVSTGFIAAKFGVVSADGGMVNSDDKLAGSLNQNAVEKATSLQSVQGDESITLALIKLLAALIVVVVGIYGFLLLLRRMMGQKFSGNRKSNLLEVIETTYVAQKKSVSLVKFADRSVLIGVGESGISVLAELDELTTSEMLAKTDLNEKAATGFKHFLSEARVKLTGLNLKTLKTFSHSKGVDKPQAA